MKVTFLVEYETSESPLLIRQRMKTVMQAIFQKSITVPFVKRQLISSNLQLSEVKPTVVFSGKFDEGAARFMSATEEEDD